MIEERDKVETESTGEDNALTLGAMLQQAREAKGLDVRAAADQLRMSRMKLMALEADAFEEFQGETFIRGYIKAYCRILDLDEAQAIARYEHYVANRMDVGQIVAARDTRNLGLGLYPKSRAKPIAFGVMVLFILVALIAFFMSSSQDVALAPAAAPIVVSAAPEKGSVQNTDTDAPNDEQSLLVADDDSQRNSNAVSSSVNSSVVGEAVAAPAPELSAVTKVAPLFDVLTIVFLEECWLEVSDAKGDVLATELKEAGSEVVLQGRAPFNVMLGNARAATVFMNGNKVDSNPRNTNRALRFTVDQP